MNQSATNGHTEAKAGSKRFPSSPTRYAQDIHRAPPHSVEAERGVLGSMLISPREAIAEVADRTNNEYFFIPAHKTIYSVLIDLFNTNQEIDLITFTQALRDRNVLETVGGAALVTSLFTFVPTAANLGYYLEIVREKYVLRSIIATGTELVRRAYEEQDEINLLLDDAHGKLTELVIDATSVNALRHVKEGAYIVLDRFEEAFHHRGQQAIHGLATGIIDFDRMTAGLKPQQLIIIGARPSHGKTALAMNLAANMAIKNEIAVAVFSMEMSYEEIVERLMCSIAEVSLQSLRLTGFMSKDDFNRLPEHASKVGAAPMWIDDSPGLTISAFKARARRARTQLGVKAIIVDYLQLMKSPTRRAQEARWLEITEISAALKSTAKELQVPVICCAQLNREAEGREFGKPKLSDLRESGSIEQDADIVALLWRPERHLENYGQREKLAKKLKLDFEENDLAERDRQINEYAELIVAKQRNGPVGEIRLRFESDITKFQNVTTKSWSNKKEERQKV